MSEDRIPLPPTAPDRKPVQIDESRRRFGKAGLGGSAVLLTLASRPVLGAQCMTPSMAGSGNHSQHGAVLCTLSQPSDWLLKGQIFDPGSSLAFSGWPTPYLPNTPFHAVFTQNSLNLDYGTYTLYEVLRGKVWVNKTKAIKDPDNTWITDIFPPKPSSPPQLAVYLVSALLSAKANEYGNALKDLLPDPSVQGIADEYARKGYFEPYAGKQWDGFTILNYLKDPGSVF